jgi:hypothetical protein
MRDEIVEGLESKSVDRVISTLNNIKDLKIEEIYKDISLLEYKSDKESISIKNQILFTIIDISLKENNINNINRLLRYQFSNISMLAYILNRANIEQVIDIFIYDKNNINFINRPYLPYTTILHTKDGLYGQKAYLLIEAIIKNIDNPNIKRVLDRGLILALKHGETYKSRYFGFENKIPDIFKLQHIQRILSYNIDINSNPNQEEIYNILSNLNINSIIQAYINDNILLTNKSFYLLDTSIIENKDLFKNVKVTDNIVDKIKDNNSLFSSYLNNNRENNALLYYNNLVAIKSGLEAFIENIIENEDIDDYDIDIVNSAILHYCKPFINSTIKNHNKTINDRDLTHV